MHGRVDEVYVGFMRCEGGLVRCLGAFMRCLGGLRYVGVERWMVGGVCGSVEVC